MTLSVDHLTTYKFSEAVFLEPHYLRFIPSHRPYYRVQEFDIQIEPSPSGMSECTGLEGNNYHQIWFNEMVDSLNISVNMKFEIRDHNPFDFFIHTGQAGSIYNATERSSLELYLETIEISESLTNWAQEIKSNADENIFSYLSQLNQSIHSEIKHIIREEENILIPGDLFQLKAGSCRDLSWLMIALLRAEGIAARFVSGYSFNPELGEGHELHAWVEAYLPGGGWIGLDPSAGIFTTNTYIAVSASFDPKLTKPVIGSYRGDAKSVLETEVRLNEER